jgi:biopolymer transport protein ExbD
MAYKPSLRRASQPTSVDLDIRPVMNLMVVLIPLLLAGAEFVKLAIIEVNLPPRAAGGGGGKSEDDKPEEKKEKKLQLSLALTEEGIFIASPAGVLGSDGEETVGPTVPLTADGKQDYILLKQKLVDIKKTITGKGFVDGNAVTLTAGREIALQTIIDVMDVVLNYKDGEETKALFPKVQFGKVM